MPKILRKTEKCLNCDYPINDANYCPQCGQINTHKQLKLKDIFHDFFTEYFTFDSKFFRSFIPLITKPGHLTNEYLKGRRISYILPLRLYIFTTFFFFFIITIQSRIGSNDLEEQKQERIVAKDSLEKMLKQYEPDINNELQNHIANAIDSSFFIQQRTNINITIGGTPDDSIRTGFKRYLADKVKTIGERGEQGWTMLFRDLLNHTPKIMFLLLPLFALLLKILYVRKGIYYINHLIFSLHVHTLIFLYLLIAVLFPEWYIILLTFIAIWFHLFVAFKNVYQQSILKTFIKLHLLLFVYIFVLAAGVIVLFIFTIVNI